MSINRLTTRPSGASTDIQHVSTFGNQPMYTLDKRQLISGTATTIKRVGRNVDDTHDPRAINLDQPPVQI